MRKLDAASLGWMLDNPVITKELRGRMRGSRAYWMLLGYLLLLSIAMLLTYYSWRQNNGGFNGSPASFTVGRNFFRILFYVQAALVTLITPALTSGAISIEREQRTFEMMRCTTLRPAAIVIGKLASSVSFIVLMLICSLPLVSICFLLGGVAPDEVVSAYAMLICDGLLFGAIGIAWSTCAANTAASTALAYLTVFAYFLLTCLTAVASQAPNASGVIPLTALNPIGAATCASQTEHYFSVSVPAWVPGLAINGLLTVLLCAVGMNRMEDYPWRRAAWVRASALAFVGVLLFFVEGGVIGIPYPAPGYPWRAMTAAYIGLAAILLFVAPFSTGDVVSEREHGLPSMPPTLNPIAGIREASMRTSVIHPILMTAVIAAVTFLTARTTSFVWSNGWTGYLWNTAGFAKAVLCVFISTALAIVGLGALYSAVLRNRWGAMILVYLTVLFAAIVPFIAYASYRDTAGLIYDYTPCNWLYASPLAALSSMVNSQPADIYPHLRFSRVMQPWVVTSLIYSAVGLATLYIGTRLRLDRQSATKPE